jgi:uncharacterized protein
MPSSTLPKVVFDTNIYISAIIFGGAPGICLDLARKKKIILFTSRAILLELAQVLDRKFAWEKEEITDVIQAIGGIAELVKPVQTVHIISEDLSDNRILEAALAAKAGFIISGDKKHILPLISFQNIKIVSATEFLKKVSR